MKLSDSLRTKCLQKYQIELALLLTRECLTRICAGTAEVDGDVNTGAIITAVSKALSSMLTEHKRWSDLASLHSFCLDREIKNKFSVTIIVYFCGYTAVTTMWVQVCNYRRTYF